MLIKRLEPGARMSQAVVANGFVFLAGQVATDPSADVEGQTRQVLGKSTVLAAAGTRKDRSCWRPSTSPTSRPSDMNRAWDPGCRRREARRATVEAKLVARSTWSRSSHRARLSSCKPYS